MNSRSNSPEDLNPSQQVFAAHAEALQGLLSTLDLEAVEQAGEALDHTIQNGNSVYCLGNGGSAATASHLATDLGWGRRNEKEVRPRVLSLAANVSLMSAVANDIGYDEVFVEQLRGLFREGDTVVAISASGNSGNVLRAVRFANDHGGGSVGLVGFDGGELKSICHKCVHIPTSVGAYELVEDVHHAVCHMLAKFLRSKAAARSSAAGGS